MLENNPNSTTDELLKQIKISCMSGGSNVNSVALAMPTFSALLVKLSNEASETAEKNIKIQNRMILLTSIILFISIFQSIIAFSQIFNNTSINHKYIVTTPQAINTNNNTKNINNNIKPIRHNKNHQAESKK